MPNWSHAPPPDPRGPSLPILRTPPNGTINAIVTSDDLIGCNTHFWRGHTVPCEAPECDACLNGMPYRWHGYIAAFKASTSVHMIFEFTAQACEAFRTYRRAHGTLRGCQFIASRWGSKPNGRVVIKTQPSGMPPNLIPTAPDLTRCMAIVWNIPFQDVTLDGIQRGNPPLQADQTDADGNGRPVPAPIT